MYTSSFASAIKVNGKVLREDKDIVMLPYGTEYTILLKNLNNKRAQVNVTIDGEVVTGNGLVINANSEIELERFIKDNLNEGNRFKFIERTEAIEQHRGIKVDDGIVRIEFQYEEEYKPFIFPTTNYPQQWAKPYPTVGTGYPDIICRSSYSTTNIATSAVVNSVASVASTTGITAPGSISDQKFSTVSSFKVESEKHVIMFKLIGTVEEYIVDTDKKLQAKEIAKCADPVTGYKYFIENYFEIQHPTKGNIKFKLHPYQTNMLANMHNFRLSINNSEERQMGLTTTTASYLLWYALFNPQKTSVVVVNTLTEQLELMNRIVFALALPDWLLESRKVLLQNKREIEFSNGSRIIVCLPKLDSVRGMNISLLCLLDFARTKNATAIEFWQFIAPRMYAAKTSKVIMVSHADKENTLYNQIWKDATNNFDRYGNKLPVGITGFSPFNIKLFDHPDRKNEVINNLKSLMSAEAYTNEMEMTLITEPIVASKKIQCTMCGKKNKSTHKFCTECGTSLRIV